MPDESPQARKAKQKIEEDFLCATLARRARSPARQILVPNPQTGISLQQDQSGATRHGAPAETRGSLEARETETSRSSHHTPSSGSSSSPEHVKKPRARRSTDARSASCPTAAPERRPPPLNPASQTEPVVGVPPSLHSIAVNRVVERSGSSSSVNRTPSLPCIHEEKVVHHQPLERAGPSMNSIPRTLSVESTASSMSPNESGEPRRSLSAFSGSWTTSFASLPGLEDEERHGSVSSRSEGSIHPLLDEDNFQQPFNQVARRRDESDVHPLLENSASSSRSLSSPSPLPSARRQRSRGFDNKEPFLSRSVSVPFPPRRSRLVEAPARVEQSVSVPNLADMPASYSLASAIPDEPTDVSSHSDPDTPRRGRGKNARVPKDSIGIGIETEFLIQSTKEAWTNSHAGLLAQDIAEAHNREVKEPLARMKSIYGGAPAIVNDGFTEWVLKGEPTNRTKRAPWGMEMVTPIFWVFNGSKWREEIQTTWGFMEKNYKITANSQCATHVHISRRKGFELEDLKKIAQCIIYFEPAFEVLVSPQRRGNWYCRSNWLDNNQLGMGKFTNSQPITPRQAIRQIGKLKSRDRVRSLMCDGISSNYAWNFHKLQDYRTIEFRKPDPSTTASQVLAWAELTLNFILVAINTRNIPSLLDTLPPNINGLKGFLARKYPAPNLLRPNPAYTHPLTAPHYLIPLFNPFVGDEHIQPRLTSPLSGDKNSNNPSTIPFVEKISYPAKLEAATALTGFEHRRYRILLEMGIGSGWLTFHEGVENPFSDYGHPGPSRSGSESSRASGSISRSASGRAINRSVSATSQAALVRDVLAAGTGPSREPSQSSRASRTSLRSVGSGGAVSLAMTPTRAGRHQPPREERTVGELGTRCSLSGVGH